MSGGEDEPALGEGWVAEAVRAELPGLRLRTLEVPFVARRPSRDVRARLRALSDRVRGPQALVLRTRPVPAAYRVFFRHVGLDPDATRTPVEEAFVRRLLQGAFASESLLDDALLVALVETGVPLWALDAARVAPPLGIAPDADGALAVHDADGPVAPLLGAIARGRGVTPATRRLLLYAVQVPGVPPIHVEEAMWQCLGVLREED